MSELVCTYFEQGKKRPVNAANARVKQLEARLSKLQTLLNRFIPQLDFTQDVDLDAIEAQVELQPRTLTVIDHAATMIRRSTERLTISPPDDALLVIDRSAPKYLRGRYHGKSSQAIFVQDIITMKAELEGLPIESSYLTRVQQGMVARRPELWLLRPWERSVLEPPRLRDGPPFSFPEDDLMMSLIDLYFEHVNFFSPLLHRPTFLKSVTSKLHLTNRSFGAVLLLVCAVGARFSHDPRVILEGYTSTLSSGWQWFNQIHETDISILASACLYDVQACCLQAEFLRGSSSPGSSWPMIGIGIRLAQDVGAHRGKTFGDQPRSIEGELWTRAWWCLVVLDRIASAAVGRDIISQEYDFDVGLPTECDDEYWDHPDPEKAWKQPEGVPSKTSFFITLLKHSQILAMALEVLYGIDKSKDIHGLKKIPGYEPQIVSELDSALNQWIATIPNHLRWDPHNKNPDWHRQSIVLYAELYLLQILIHRPFIAGSPKPTPLAISSLAICTNAARACSHILNTQEEQCLTVVYRIQWPIFSAALVLLLSVWGGKRAGLATNQAKEMQDVFKCMKMLASTERSFQSSGQLRDALRELASAGDLILPICTPPSKKRALEPDSPTGPELAEDAYTAVSGVEAFFLSDAEYGFCSTLPMKPSLSGHQLPPSSLPLYSDDLARLPLFSQTPAELQAAGVGHEGSIPPLNGLNHGHDPFIGQAGLSTLENELSQPHGGSGESSSHASSNDYLDFGSAPLDILDPEILAMWSNVPSEYGAQQWNNYLSSVNEIQMSSVLDGVHMQ